jgi:endo-1,4-beta-xylanase
MLNTPLLTDQALSLRQAARLSGLDIGTAVEPAHLEIDVLREIILSEFSVIEAENAMKFGPIHPRPGSDESAFDFAGADRLVEFAQKNGLKVRGHTLVWHNQNPPWITSGELKPEELARALEGHIDRVVGRYAGKVYAWDVVNEAFADDGSMRHTVWYDRPGIGLSGTAYIERALRRAREADPKARLFYNDYGAETLGPKADAIFAMAKDFRERGVPLDGIGFQAHLIMPMDNPGALESIEKNFERFAKLGLDIEITELDIRLSSGSPDALAAQAGFYERLVALCRRQHRCKLIQTWGVSDKHSWIPRAFRGMGWALLWDDKCRKKPAYEAVLRALTGKGG